VSDADKIFDEIIGAQKVRNPELRALIEERMKAGGEVNSKREKLRELLSSGTMAAMDTGKVEMRKAPGAKKAEEALSTAAEFIPFVGAGKAAAEGDYGSAALQAGMDVAGGPLLKGAAALGGKFLAPALAGAIKAYHGSPHKFDKFDISKIGTGEGAQAYGHGLYTAEARKVGEEYARNLVNRDAANQGRLNAHANAQRLANLAKDPERAADDIRYVLEVNPNHEQKKLLTDTLKFLKSGEWEKPLKDEGYLYELNLRWPDAAREAADPLGPHHFLDWDKPYAEQPQSVKDALMALWKESGGKVPSENFAPYTAHSGSIGQNMVGALGMSMAPPMANNAAIQKAASEALLEKGIPGIRYKDAASRGTEGGTSNYVLFSDELADILKRNDEQLKASKVAAPRDEALRIAQENAVKMLGLPPGNTPMDRAQALGYVEDAYHGAPLGFQGSSVEFPKGANRTSKKLQGFYGSTHPERASLYAENADGAFDASAEVLPLRMKMGKSFDLQGDRMLTQNEKDALFKMIEPLGPSGWAKGKMDNAHTQSDMFRIMTYAGVPDAQQREVLMQLGYTTAKDGHELITLNPANVRSRFAAFDPSRIEENDLLAGLAALGIGLPALSLSTDKDYD